MLFLSAVLIYIPKIVFSPVLIKIAYTDISGVCSYLIIILIIYFPDK